VVAVEWAQYLEPSYFELEGTVALEIESGGENRRRITVRTELPYIKL
jgi:hypothetical protein